MIFTKPADFEQAIRKMAGKTPIGAMLSTADWQNLPVALRDRAFFSARIENSRFLQAAKDAIDSFLKQEVEILPNGEKALKIDGRARFISEMQKLAISEGMGPLGPIRDKSILDIRSNTRLGLIFDTQTRQAYHYGNWKSGLNESILMVYPAQRFVRHPGAKIKRPLHQQNENVVKLKSDTAFWLKMNDPEIGGFDVPWGPWGFNSYMDVRDVERQATEDLGLMKPEDPPPKVRDVDFNAQLKASVTNLDPGIESVLRQVFGRQVVFKGGEVYWRGQKPLPTPLPPAKVKRAPKPKKPPAGSIAPPGAKPKLATGAEIRALVDPTKAADYQALEKRVVEIDKLRESRKGEASSIAGRDRLWAERRELRAKQRILKAQAESELRKALEIPPEMRGKISISKGGDVHKDKNSQKDPSPSDWVNTRDKTEQGAAWIEKICPKESLQPVIYNYYGSRNFARPTEWKVFLNENTRRDVVAHEIAHLMESNNKGWYQAAKDFRARRTQHEAPVKLKDYYKNPDYEDHEIALKDKWAELNSGESIYCGKVYHEFTAKGYENWNSTEIVSVGFEWLERRPMEFMLGDPDYFDFMVNLIRGL